MIIVDNFKRLLNPFIENLGRLNRRTTPTHFMQVQILRRHKDGNSTKSHKSELVKAYYIRDEAEYEAINDEVVKICQVLNARAYINLNIKDFDQVAKLCALEMTTAIFDHENRSHKMSDLYNSCASRGGIYGWPVWVIDVDDLSEKDDIVAAVQTISKETTAIRGIIPTVNGIHILTSPFDRQKFAEYGFISTVEANRNTLLYASIDDEP
jgi:hypothetical protein